MSTPKSHIVFIADVHLSYWREATTEKFLFFLTHCINQQTQALYILGDLFMLWAGDDDHSAYVTMVKKALKEKTSQGTPVFIQRGNRDFLLGEDFAKTSGCQLIEDPTIIELFGIPTILTHGDKLCKRETTHLKFRSLTNHQLFKKVFFVLPLFVRKGLAWLTHFLCLLHVRVPYKKLTAMIEDEAKLLAIATNTKQIIHGHLHRQDIDRSDPNLLRIALGGWDSNGSALFYYQDGSFEFKNF